MIKITITSDKTSTPPPSVINPKTQKPYTFRSQTAYLHEVSKDGEISEIPAKFDFILADDQQPYPRGQYTLADSAAYLDRDGRIALRMQLIALAIAQTPKA